MKNLINAIKHAPSTLVGLLIIAAAIYMWQSGKIEFVSFQDYLIEGVMFLLGLRAITYAPKTEE